MGKHSGKQDPKEIAGHGKDTPWNADATPQQKADNFDAYDRHITNQAGPDTSNPYKK